MEIETIGQISPSRYFIMEKCQLRYFKESGTKNKSKQKIFEVNSFLGNVIHKVAKEYFLEPFGPRAFDEKWNEKLLDEFESFKSTGLNQKFNLLPYTLPYYTIKKNKLKKLLNNFIALEGSKPVPEKPIDNELIRGSIDLYEESDKLIRITDFKSGPIYGFSDFEKRDPKEVYLKQLEIYALGVYLDKGLLKPIQLRLKGLNEDEDHRFMASIGRLEALNARIQESIKGINSKILLNQVETLASPNEEICHFCPNALECRALHTNLREYRMPFFSMAIISPSNAEFIDQEKKIMISTYNGTYSLYGIPLKDYGEIKSNIDSGKSIFAQRLFTVANSRKRWWTENSQYTHVS